MKDNIEQTPGWRRRPPSFRELRQAGSPRFSGQEWEEDELTRDALEGMRLLPHPEQTEVRVNQLRERAKLRLGALATRRRSRVAPVQTWGWALASAAATLLLAVFLIFPSRPQPTLADASPAPLAEPPAGVPEQVPAAAGPLAGSEHREQQKPAPLSPSPSFAPAASVSLPPASPAEEEEMATQGAKSSKSVDDPSGVYEDLAPASPQAASPRDADAERPAGAAPVLREERSRKESTRPAPAGNVEAAPRMTEAQVRQAELLKAQGIADLIEEGRRLLEAGNSLAAQHKFEEALLGEPENLSAHYYLAKALMAQGKPQQALRPYQQVVNNPASPLYEEARWELANAYLEAGKAQAARSLLAAIADAGGKYAEEARRKLAALQK